MREKLFKYVICVVLFGMAGTAAMDLANFYLVSFGYGYEINYKFIGAVVRGWLSGAFLYSSPSEISPVSEDYAFGLISHYVIGIIFAVPASLIFFLYGRSAIVLVTVYGAATSLVSLTFLFHSLGLGAFASKTESPWFFVLTNLFNHSFFGIGMSAGAFLASIGMKGQRYHVKYS